MRATADAQQDASERLPVGFRVRIRDDVDSYDHGRVLVGGSPLRALRLTDAAGRLITDRTVEVRSATSQALAVRLLDTNVADPIVEGIDVDPARLTVVIPVYNRPVQLDRALAALAPLRCIVVDDASADAGSVNAVADRHRARLIRLPSNGGPAAARNAGLRQAQTEFVAFVDSDVEVTAAALLDLTRHFTDRRVGLVGPLVRSRSRSTEPRWFERYDERSSSLALGDRACQVAPGAHVAWLPSACLVARRAVLTSGFDSRMRVGEDVDLVWRLVDDNVVVRYDPTVVALHDARPDLRQWLGRKFLYGTGGAPLAQRHGDRTSVAALAPTTAIAAAALLQRRPWSFPIAALCVTDAARRLHSKMPDGDERDRVAMLLALRGLGWGVRQEAALLLRHWAPPVLVGCLVSRRLRRAVDTALLVDAVVALAAGGRSGARDALLDSVARRLDDLAYGAGLWAGLLRVYRRPSAWRCVGIRLARREYRIARAAGHSGA